MADELRGIVARNEDTVTLVEALFGLEAIFGELSNDRMFSNRVAHWLGELRTHSVGVCEAPGKRQPRCRALKKSVGGGPIDAEGVK